MFIGEYTHTIDTKKRLSIPTRMRKELGNVAVVTRGLDQCLFLYTESTWNEMAGKLSNLPLGQADTRNFVRLMLAGASEQEVDSLGRILVPEHLKQYANLEGKVIIAGVFNRIELWSPKRWEQVKKKTEEDADRLAERLGELGVY